MQGIRLDFPRNDPRRVDPPGEALRVLGVNRFIEVAYSETNKKLLVRLDSEEAVRSVKPDFAAFLRAPNPLGWRGAIVTAKGDGRDFVSRYFAPYMGVDEDPVTGSAHTVLAPYWASIRGKNTREAYQASPRGGELIVELKGERVLLTGGCVTVMEGTLRF